MKTTEKYVIVREDGQFYWRGTVSSMWGYTEDFDRACLFETPKGAKTRLFTARPMTASIRAVEVTLYD